MKACERYHRRVRLTASKHTSNFTTHKHFHSSNTKCPAGTELLCLQPLFELLVGAESDRHARHHFAVLWQYACVEALEASLLLHLPDDSAVADRLALVLPPIYLYN
jgi:hypothetical protein